MLIQYRFRTLLTPLPVLFQYDVASFVVACKRGWPVQWFRAWRWLLASLEEIAARRRKMQRARSVNDRDLLVDAPRRCHPGFSILRSRGACIPGSRSSRMGIGA